MACGQVCACQQKSLSSIYRKMQHRPLDQIRDRYAIEVIVSRRPLCYLALGILHERFLPVMARFKEFIALPKRNGYQALHTCIHHRDRRYELHIQTPAMHRLGEFGIGGPCAETRSTKNAATRWLHDFADWHDQTAHTRYLMSELNAFFLLGKLSRSRPWAIHFILPEDATVVDFAFAVHKRPRHAVQRRAHQWHTGLSVFQTDLGRHRGNRHGPGPISKKNLGQARENLPRPPPHPALSQ